MAGKRRRGRPYLKDGDSLRRRSGRRERNRGRLQIAIVAAMALAAAAVVLFTA